LLAISPRLPSRSSSTLPGSWQMGCNRKLTLLVSEHFSEMKGRFKRPLSLQTQLRQIYHGGKTDLLIEKKLIRILAGYFLYQTLETTQKFVKGRPISFCELCVWWEYKNGGAPLTTLPSDNVNRGVIYRFMGSNNTTE